MSSVFEKRLDRLQNKIQVKINLANDEIDRLKSDYAIIQGEIIEVMDLLNKLKNNMTQVKHLKSGMNIRKQVSIDTMVSKMKSDYTLRLQELEMSHSQQINILNQDYENSMKEIERHSDIIFEEQVEPLNKQIEQMKEDLKKMKYEYQAISSINNQSLSQSSLNSAMDDEFRSSHDEEVQKIRSLEKKIHATNQERLNSILQGKERLQQCVETIDEMEKNHSTEMDNYKTKLDALDNMYQDKIRLATEKHHRTIETLTKKLNQYNDKINSIQSTIQKVQDHHKLQIDRAIAEGDSLSSQISEKAKQYSASFSGLNLNISIQKSEISNSNDYSQVRDAMDRLSQLKEKLEKCENELFRERTENESMKREIARLKHEKKMAPRIQNWKSNSAS